MQLYYDTTNNKQYAFNPDVQITGSPGSFVFKTSTGSVLGPYPATLVQGTAPYVAPTIVPVTQVTPLEFKARFTTSEWGSILITATTDPTVLGWIFEASAATYIDLTDPNTTLGLTYLSTRNPSLLDATRIPVLLSTSS